MQLQARCERMLHKLEKRQQISTVREIQSHDAVMGLQQS